MIDELAFYTFFALLMMAPLINGLLERGRRRWKRFRGVVRPA